MSDPRPRATRPAPSGRLVRTGRRFLVMLAAAVPVVGASAWAVARSAPPAPPNVVWTTFGGNLANWRLAGADQITAGNVRDVQKLFTYAVPKNGGGMETYPLEVGGTLLFTSSGGDVYALNAATGAVQWTYTPSPQVRGVPNRGVAVLGSRVYVLTPDDWLIALARATGKPLFRVQVADPSTGAFESTAPIAADGEVVIGSAGGDQGVRGFVSAYFAQTGKLLWRTYTVPALGQGWMAGSSVHGGGAVWMPPAVNLTTRTVFVGTGNPAPDFFGPVRPGADPYTDSVLALSLKTGAIEWAYSETRHDLWDYDAASPPVLLTVDVKGRLRRPWPRRGRTVSSTSCPRQQASRSCLRSPSSRWIIPPPRLRAR